MKGFNVAQERYFSNFLERFFGEERAKLGFERIAPLLASQMKSNPFIVTIAGTNGKGETAYSLGHLLCQHHQGNYVWSSPHILSIRERFRKDNDFISYDELRDECQETLALMESKDISLSYYEYLFLVFVRWAQKSPRSIWILEVGLGGRLDAVNCLTPNVSVITSISRDHEEILGRGYVNILKEKLGITRDKVPLFSALELKLLRAVTLREIERQQIPWRDLFSDGTLTKEMTFPEKNQRMAMAVCQFISTTQVPMNLKSFKDYSFPVNPGRGETVTINGISFIFRGAHNFDGIRQLDFYLGGQEKIDLCLLGFSKRPDKEIQRMLTMVRVAANFPDKICVTNFVHIKAYSFTKAFVDEYQLTFIQEWKKFLLSEGNRGKKIFISGSFYFIGEVQSYLFSKSK